MKNNGEIFIGALEGKIYVFNILNAPLEGLRPEVTFALNPTLLPHSAITSICHLPISTLSIDTLVLVQGGRLHTFAILPIRSGQVDATSFVLTESGQAVPASECSGNEQQGIVNVQILEPPTDDISRDARFVHENPRV